MVGPARKGRCRRTERRTGLQEPGLREGVFSRLHDDQVIKDAHVNELQRLAEALRDDLVAAGPTRCSLNREESQSAFLVEGVLH